MPTREEVVDALHQVEDPELGMDIVDLGLLYDVEVDGPKVKVSYTLTSMGCPAGAMIQEDIDRVQEFRKCIECFLCQDVCHVLRDHAKHDEFIGPRFFVHTAALEMHPLDTEDRLPELKEAHGVGFCNITKCCTVVCPEHITITDNAIIPLKERVVDRFYDPLKRLFRLLTGRK